MIFVNQRGASMKKQIIRVSPFQTAKVSAVLYFLMSIPVVALMALSLSFAPASESAPGIGVLILFPILYLIFGFIFTAIAAWAYNLVAGWVGGVEFTSITVDSTE